MCIFFCQIHPLQAIKSQSEAVGSNKNPELRLFVEAALTFCPYWRHTHPHSWKSSQLIPMWVGDQVPLKDPPLTAAAEMCRVMFSALFHLGCIFS